MTETQPTSVRIDKRFNGPDNSGNGGYVAGLVGARVTSPVGAATTVDLRVPPPLDRDLGWVEREDTSYLVDDDTVIASGRTGVLETEDPIVARVDRDDAATARSAYEGYHGHPFPNCFTCGSAREAGDGLQLYSGPLPDGRMACTWVPHERFGDADGMLAPEFAWAALDCPGGWAAHIKQTPMVLARMTAQLYRRPRVGEECIVVGALRGVERRKNLTATALYTSDGALAGRAEQIWITIDILAFS